MLLLLRERRRDSEREIDPPKIAPTQVSPVARAANCRWAFEGLGTFLICPELAPSLLPPLLGRCASRQQQTHTSTTVTRLAHTYCWRISRERRANCTEELFGCAGVAIAGRCGFPSRRRRNWAGKESKLAALHQFHRQRAGLGTGRVYCSARRRSGALD